MNTIAITPHRRTHLIAISLFVVWAASLKISALAAPADSLFSTEEILDESTLDIKILQDWHPVGSTRQKLIEINVAEWWPGQDYRIPVRMIVPLEGKAKGFSITGANPYETLMEDSRPSDFQAKLLAGGVGIVKTFVKSLRESPGKQGLEQKMGRMFMKDLNSRYTTLWIWSMTLMRATTAAYSESDHFEKGKVAGSGSSKNGISPAVALINDERFTATCSDHAFAYYSPTRRGDREAKAKAEEANKAFFEAVKAGDIDLDPQRGKIYQRVMVGSEGGMDKMALKAGKSMDEMQSFADRFWAAVSVTENWDRLMERGVDVLFQPGTHDYVAFDVLWGAQNHPQLPVYYQANGGHYQTPHVAAAKDEQNRDAFLWHHFFGGESLLKPPASSHKVDKDKLRVRVSFDEGPQPTSGRIWWIYDRAPAGSAPFLHVPIPEDQWADMKRDPKTGSWTATIPLKEGASRVDFFSNHGHTANGYKQYLSSPYTRVEIQREAEEADLNETLEGINDKFKKVNVAFEYVGPAIQQKGMHVWGTSPVVGEDGRIHLFVAQWPIPDGEGATKEKKRGGFNGYYTTSEVAHYAGDSPEGPFEFVRMIAEDQDGGFNSPHNPTIKHIDGKYALCFIVNKNDDRGTQRIVMYVADDVNGEFRPAQGGEVDGTVLRAPSDPEIWNHGSVRGVANPSLIKYDDEYRIYFKSAMPAPEKGVEGFYNREFGYGVATSKNLEGPYTIHPERLTSKEVELEDAYVFTHADKVYMISRDIEASRGSKEGGLLWVSEDGYEFPEEKVQRSFEGLAAYKGDGEWQDYTLYRGSKEGQLERPQLLQYDGEFYLYTATGASTGPGFGSGSHILKMKFE